MDQELLDQLQAARFPLGSAWSPDSVVEPFYRLAPGDDSFFSTHTVVVPAPSPGGLGRWSDRPIGAERWGVSLLALGVLVFYCWLAYRYRKAVATALKSVFSLEETFRVFDHMPHEFTRFLSFSRLLVFCSGALFVVLFPALEVEGSTALLWWGGGVFYLYGSLGVQRLLLWLVSRFDAIPDRLLVLERLNRLDWAVVGVFFPLLVVVVLGFEGLWPVSIGVFGVAVLVHWVRLFVYFKWAGFSIVQWFLYLCALEVFPFTLLWGIGRWIGLSY